MINNLLDLQLSLQYEYGVNVKIQNMLKQVTFLIASFVFISCSSTSIYDNIYPTLNDGKYDSEFPYKNSSEQLENISNSVHMINSIAF